MSAVPTEARDTEFSGVGATGSFELPNMGSRNHYANSLTPSFTFKIKKVT